MWTKKAMNQKKILSEREVGRLISRWQVSQQFSATELYNNRTFPSFS